MLGYKREERSVMQHVTHLTLLRPSRILSVVSWLSRTQSFDFLLVFGSHVPCLLHSLVTRVRLWPYDIHIECCTMFISPHYTPLFLKISDECRMADQQLICCVIVHTDHLGYFLGVNERERFLHKFCSQFHNNFINRYSNRFLPLLWQFFLISSIINKSVDLRT
jgi:hypothetical protein